MKQSKKSPILKGEPQRFATVLGIYTGRRGRGAPVPEVATPQNKKNKKRTCGDRTGVPQLDDARKGSLPRSKVKCSLFRNVTAKAQPLSTVPPTTGLSPVYEPPLPQCFRSQPALGCYQFALIAHTVMSGFRLSHLDSAANREGLGLMYQKCTLDCRICLLMTFRQWVKHLEGAI